MSGFYEWQRQRLLDAGRPQPITDWWTDQSVYNEAPREMTAADLGLPLGQWSTEWLCATYHWPPEPAWCAIPDAPYAFWLGDAESEMSRHTNWLLRQRFKITKGAAP